jgi:hypothetical protein
VRGARGAIFEGKFSFRICGTFSDELRVLIDHFGWSEHIHSGFIQVCIFEDTGW